MIQKCPHCNSDVIFSRDICPACGHTSHDEERLDSSYTGDKEFMKFHPVYTREMELRMNETQKRGRTLTGLIIIMMLAPAVTYNVVLIMVLAPRAWPVVVLVVESWLLLKLWQGTRGLRILMILASGATGIGGLVALAVYRMSLGPIMLLFCTVYGILLSWCSWNLCFSNNLQEFLKYQAKIQRD